MRQTTVIIAGICLAGGLALADSLTINNLPYDNVRVTDVSKGMITYELSGRRYDKPLADVSRVVLGGQKDFNKAEDAFKAGKFAEAVAAYTQAEKSADKADWLPRLVRYRRMSAAAAAKMSGQAVADWLSVVDEAAASRAAIALAPDAVATKGSPDNALAIELLEKRVGKGDPMFRAKVKDLLLKLYDSEDLKDKAAMLQSEAPGTAPAGDPAGRANGGEQEPPPLAVSVEQVSRQLQEAASQIRLGQYDAAAESIKAKINRFTSGELPGALVLRGKALQLSYEKGGSKDVKKLKEAGLCFMRVAACCDPTTPQAPEALYLAAMVSRALGNEVAAANTLRMLIDRYATSDWARKAQAALSGSAETEK
jgi:TolA-binding protein